MVLPVYWHSHSSVFDEEGGYAEDSAGAVAEWDNNNNSNSNVNPTAANVWWTALGMTAFVCLRWLVWLYQDYGSLVLISCCVWWYGWFLRRAVSILQFTFILYQWIMIALAASTLYGLTFVHNFCSYYGLISPLNKKKRRWKQAMENVESYQQFKQLLESFNNHNNNNNKTKTNISDSEATATTLPDNNDNNNQVIPNHLVNDDDDVLGPERKQRLREITCKLKKLLSSVSQQQQQQQQDQEHQQQDQEHQQQDQEQQQQTLDDLQHVLLSEMERNPMGLEDVMCLDGRSVTWTGQQVLAPSSRQLIDQYYALLERCIDTIAQAPPITTTAHTSNANSSTTSSDSTNSTDNTTTTSNNNNNNTSQQQQIDQENEDAAVHNDTRHLSRQTTTSSRFHQQQQQQQQYFPDLDPASQELVDRINMLEKMKQSLGRTGLMLSGGGILALYHCGLIVALIEAGLYDDIKIISGTSGGSNVAALCAIHTPEELLQVLPTLHKDYTSLGRHASGEMAKRNIHFCPPLPTMMVNFLRTGHVMEASSYRSAVEFYFADITFEEAYQRTGKHVSVSVSASRANGVGGSQKLLLNHMTAPHVTIASACAASGSMPGLMKSNQLAAKLRNGDIVPFAVDGHSWVDGSLQADLPFEGLTSTFAVCNYIVSQTNFFVAPFLITEETFPNEHDKKKKNKRKNKRTNKDTTDNVNKALTSNGKGGKNSSTPFQKNLIQVILNSIRNRIETLDKLGFLPYFGGQDFSVMFRQRYTGHITLYPSFTLLETTGVKSLMQPSDKHMHDYIKYGAHMTYPFIDAMKTMVRLESALLRCLDQLKERQRSYMVAEYIRNIENRYQCPTNLVIGPSNQHDNHSYDDDDDDDDDDWKTIAAPAASSLSSFSGNTLVNNSDDRHLSLRPADEEDQEMQHQTTINNNSNHKEDDKKEGDDTDEKKNQNNGNENYNYTNYNPIALTIGSNNVSTLRRRLRRVLPDYSVWSSLPHSVSSYLTNQTNKMTSAAATDSSSPSSATNSSTSSSAANNDDNGFYSYDYYTKQQRRQSQEEAVDELYQRKARLEVENKKLEDQLNDLLGRIFES